MSAKTFTAADAASANIVLADKGKGSQAVHDLVTAYRANRRTGSANTKTRGEVRGNNKKIYRQKGTGGARHGDKRAPIFVGGGVVFGPDPRDHGHDMNKKERRQALCCALSKRVADEAILVVDNIEFAGAKTKSAVAMLGKFEVSDVLLVVDEITENIDRTTRNLPNITVVPTIGVNVYDILRRDNLVITQSAVASLTQRLVG